MFLLDKLIFYSFCTLFDCCGAFFRNYAKNSSLLYKIRSVFVKFIEIYFLFLEILC